MLSPNALTNAGGCDSIVTVNLTINSTTSSVLFISTCNKYTLNGVTYYYPGKYKQVRRNHRGCDSILTLVLNLDSVDLDIYRNGRIFTSKQAAASYQWLDCSNNMSPVEGATKQTFITPGTGSYAVFVSKGICNENSYCYEVEATGLESKVTESVTLYPNPAGNLVSISFPDRVENASVRLEGMMGQVILDRTGISGDMYTLEIDAMPSGVYFVEVNINGSVTRQKLIKGNY